VVFITLYHMLFVSSVKYLNTIVPSIAPVEQLFSIASIVLTL